MSDTPEIDDAPEIRLLRGGMVPDHERLNGRLRALLLDMAARIPDKGTNKAAGTSYFSNKWLSARDLFLSPDPAIAALTGFVEAATNRFPWPGLPAGRPLKIEAMWAIVSRDGMEGAPHRHSGLVSGAYYVDEGACDNGRNGAFAVYTPRGRLVKAVPPRAGLMLLFPAAMWHGVLRYQGEQPRMVISFNLS
jgi:hypothetical protein